MWIACVVAVLLVAFTATALISASNSASRDKEIENTLIEFVSKYDFRVEIQYDSPINDTRYRASLTSEQQGLDALADLKTILADYSLDKNVIAGVRKGVSPFYDFNVRLGERDVYSVFFNYETKTQSEIDEGELPEMHLIIFRAPEDISLIDRLRFKLGL